MNDFIYGVIDFFLNILKKNKKMAELIDDKFRDQFIRYLIVGFSTFAVEYSLFLLLSDRINYLLANTLIYIVVFWFNFLLNRNWSFKSSTNIVRQVLMYGCLFALNLIVANIGLLYLLTDIIGIHKNISKVLIMFAIVSWNFILYKKVIYK